MTFRAIAHIALLVPQLRDAEAYYRHLFGMQVAYRETFVEGEWRTFREARPWTELAETWPQPMISVLTRDAFTLMLEHGSPSNVRDVLDHVAIRAEAEDVAELRWRAEDANCQTISELDGLLVFVDRYLVQWEVNALTDGDPISQSSGMRAGRWVE